jgi:hypothetical protein
MTDGVLQALSRKLSWDTIALHVDPGKSPVFKTAYENSGPNEWCAMVSSPRPIYICPFGTAHWNSLPTSPWDSLYS